MDEQVLAVREQPVQFEGIVVSHFSFLVQPTSGRRGFASPQPHASTSFGGIDARHTATLTQDAQAFGFTFRVNVLSGK
jgi:hypothetical protein